MFGDYMLIVPITNYSQNINGFNLTKATFWLPPNVYSGYLYYYESIDDLKEGKIIQRWFDISEMTIYIKCTSNTIIPIQPFNSNEIIGRAILYYTQLLLYTPNNNLYDNGLFK